MNTFLCCTLTVNIIILYADAEVIKMPSCQKAKKRKTEKPETTFLMFLKKTNAMVYMSAILWQATARGATISINMQLMDGWIRFYVPFNSISVISGRWKGEHERLCAMKCCLGSGRISPPAGFEPGPPWSEVGSAHRSATRTLRINMQNRNRTPLYQQFGI